MGWTLAPLEFRDILPSVGACCASTLLPDEDSAPSINGVVGSSLLYMSALRFASSAQQFVVFAASSGEKLTTLYSAACSALASALLRSRSGAIDAQLCAQMALAAANCRDANFFAHMARNPSRSLGSLLFLSGDKRIHKKHRRVDIDGLRPSQAHTLDAAKQCVARRAAA